MKTFALSMLLNTPRIVFTFFVVVLGEPAFGAPGDKVRSANTLGLADAPVTIEFFSDLQCPQCARYEPIVQAIRGEFGDKVRMILRHCPLKEHEHAYLASCAAEAAANQGKFWDMVARLYKTQWIWGKAPAPRAILIEQAKQMGMDTDQFEKDMDGSQVQNRIEADEDHAQSVGVKSVPAVVINGYHVPNSEFNEDGFRAAIKAALAKANQ
jgi:predicted DsbA family dithiol-disulfide isomerase